MKRWQQKSKVTILGLLAGLTLTSQAIAMAPPQGGSSEGGSMIKKLGTEARKDIETFLGQKVFLELFVKVP